MNIWSRLLNVVALLCHTVNCTVSIWPSPASLTLGEGVLWLRGPLEVQLLDQHGDSALLNNEYSSLSHPELQTQRSGPDNIQAVFQSYGNGSKVGKKPLTELDVLEHAIADFLRTVQHTRFVPWKFYPRDTDFDPEKSHHIFGLEALAITQQDVNLSGNLKPQDFFEQDEAYEIDVDQTTHIRSKSTLGTLRALQTLKQLFYQTNDGDVYAVGAGSKIVDQPKWQHRGLSLDIARNVYHPKDVQRTLDAMAFCKLSRLHIHATDSQSWPLDIPSLPDLAKKGSYHPSQIWTADTLAQVQRYGIMKGVDVFVEIDMPGHTASIGYAYPDLVTGLNIADWPTFSLEPNAGQLKLNSSDVTTFISTILTDLLPRTSTYSGHFHLGGDELNTQIYLLDPTVRSNATSILQPLIQAFFAHALKYLQTHNLRPIFWEEAILDWNLTLPNAHTASSHQDALIQVWRNGGRFQEILERGHRAIFGEYSEWYLDCGFGGFSDPYPNGTSPPGVPYNTSGGQPSQLKRPYLDYCQPYHNWRQVYTYNPLKDVREDLHHLVHGGEVLLWSEQTDSIDVDFKLWPRAAAAAEVLWSGIREETMIEDAGRRLGQWRERVLELGVKSGPVHMTHCLMYGGCNL